MCTVNSKHAVVTLRRHFCLILPKISNLVVVTKFNQVQSNSKQEKAVITLTQYAFSIKALLGYI